MNLTGDLAFNTYAAAGRRLSDALDGTEKQLAVPGCMKAGLCVLAALDFLRRMAMKPEDPQMAQKARKEGWIWVRRPVE